MILIFMLKSGILSMISTIDRPSRPKDVSFQYDGTMHFLNISWTDMTFVMGVELNYTIVFGSEWS